jgi:hypothetical protein
MAENAHVLVVYESMFGNTGEVAEAIAEGMRSAADVEVVRVDAAPAHLPAGTDLLVVGGPTHAFSMSRSSTRTSAVEQGTVVMPIEAGIRDWLDTLRPENGAAVPVASFDTRVTKVRRLPGSAAKAAAKALKRDGFKLLVPPASFYVEDMTGPLSEGELDRARSWGKNLMDRLVPRS